MLLNNETTCYGHVLNTSGKHIYSDYLINDKTYDKEIKLNNTLEVGLYNVNVWCNSSKEAGFISDTFKITILGKDVNNGSTLLAGLFGIGLFIVILLGIGFKLDDSHKILRTFIILISFFLLLLIPKLMIGYNIGFIDLTLYNGYIIFLKVFVFYLGGYFLYTIADYYGKTEAFKRFLSNFKNKGGR